MMSGDHVPKKRGSILMYNHDQDQQYYFTGDLNDERSTGFFSSFPSDDDDLLPSHDNINSSITTAPTPTPLMFNHGGLTINHYLPNYTTSTDTNFVTTSIFSDYGLGAAAHRYNLRPELVTKDGITMSSIMDVNTSTALSPASAGGGGVMISTTPYNTTPVTGNSSVSSPSTDLEEEEDAAGGQEDSSISSRTCDNNNTATTINKADYNIDHHRMNHMDDQEEGKQPMLIKENDDTTAAGGGDKSKKLLSKSGKKGEKRQKEPRFAFMTKSEVDHLEDGYRWRKYGQKAVKNSPYPRSYYRCTTQKCSVKKRVERSYQDPSIVITTYEGQHTHQSPATVRGSSHILVPPPPSMLTMPRLSNFHQDDNHMLKLHQLMNSTSYELGTAAGAIFNQSSINNYYNTNTHVQSLMTSDPSLRGQQFHQELLPAAAADHYGFLQDHMAIPSSFNINSNQVP